MTQSGYEREDMKPGNGAQCAGLTHRARATLSARTTAMGRTGPGLPICGSSTPVVSRSSASSRMPAEQAAAAAITSLQAVSSACTELSA